MSENKNITVWGKPFCGQCVSTTNWLEMNGIDYDYKDITASENHDKLMAFLDSGLRAAPIVEVSDWMGSITWSGHDVDKLETIDGK